ncbi:hypothetical protein EYF80_065143 [Liparis tanakae]|uniref:Uncharacterized protein n=1 Tax=Liparis tanakae TaxID=230148 RepID=A0A4Z2E7J4_9TELE|nr:hypothetical protein EYF80_065143 [Liparis tanakae]
MDESLDLFGDDEAFLQVSMPDVSTPGAASRTFNASRSFTPTRPRSTTFAGVNAGESTHTRPGTPPRSLDGAYYSVNFDLGYSLEDSDEAEREAGASASPPPEKTDAPAAPAPAASISSVRPEPGKRGAASLLASPSVSAVWAPAPITPPGVGRRPRPPGSLLSGLKRRRREENAPPQAESDSEDDVVVPRRRRQVKPFSSPDVVSEAVVLERQLLFVFSCFFSFFIYLF